MLRSVLLACFGSAVAVCSTVSFAQKPEGESFFFTPPGFEHEGKPAVADGAQTGKLHIVVRETKAKQPIPCRINVVGPDGNFYQPAHNRLSKYSLSGEWPNQGAWGNRRDKAPYRYLGRYFYTTGETSVTVPAGKVRIEVTKGLEYQPQQQTLRVEIGQTRDVEIIIERVADMSAAGYFSGDSHLHFAREAEQDDDLILDLLEAEDVRFGTPLAYNEPAGPYSGFMEKMHSPQFRKLGEQSTRRRGHFGIQSGQEYRSSTYGHLNLYLRSHLVFPGQDLNSDNWPVYGHVGAETQSLGGIAIHAHGGYALEIYADAALGTVNGVELLQFGVYRGIGLQDWYHILNTGYRFPCVGASDFPACRFLADCRTYAWIAPPQEKPTPPPVPSPTSPSISDWLRATAEGRSFVTTGPLLSIDVEGHRPGEIIGVPKSEPTELLVKLRARCEVTPVTKIDLIVNGEIAKHWDVPTSQVRGAWWEVDYKVTAKKSVWIAARAYSKTPGGQPDAESHTNPVYVYMENRTPYRKESLDVWVERIDKQMEAHTKRTFAEKAKTLAYFQEARDVLLAIRERNGLGAGEHPSQLRSLVRGDTSPPGLVSPHAAEADLVSDTGRLNASDEELKEFLKPVPAKSPRDALKAFDVANDFHMELVAAEPLVYDPVAAAFDADGNLYVCEMRDYPYKPSERADPIGSVRLLRDLDNDGQFDESHLFADKLLWAAGVVPWKGGVFVAAAPDIWYFKDTDGDFRADVKRRVFTGFGLDNQQAMLNNLQWSFEHWIYGATAGNGGAVRRAEDSTFVPISVSGRDFRFDPVSEQFEPTTGTVQFGNTFDDWGNRFVCSESQPLQHVVLAEHYLARNPFLPTPGSILNLAPGPVPIFRISPVERWRQIRSSRRIIKNERAASSAGASHHVIDAAAGVTVYRGGAYPSEYYGNIFIGDGQNNLVHRRKLTPDGITFKSHRADEKTDFIRSPDIWFRPVNFVNAPDGTLYCLDMSREVLESIHVPLDVVKHLDLTNGRNHGRIYRLTPPGFHSPSPPRLTHATSLELVHALENSHGWWRDTAHRLIFERQDKSMVEPLRRLARKSPRAESRMLALWSLEGLQSLDVVTLQSALSDDYPEVRVQAVRLCEPQLRNNSIDLALILKLVEDSSLRVQFQVALSLGESSDPQIAGALAKLLRQHFGDRWLRTAVMSSAVKVASPLFVDLVHHKVNAGASNAVLSDPEGLQLLGRLALIAGATGGQSDIHAVMATIADPPVGLNQANCERLALELCRGVTRSGKKIVVAKDESRESEFWKNVLLSAEKTVVDSKADASQRRIAVELLGAESTGKYRQQLFDLIQSSEAEDVQIAVIRALIDDQGPAFAQLLLSRLATFTPESRRAAFDALLANEARTLLLLKAALRGEAPVMEIEPVRRELLIQHRNASIQQLAKQLFGSATTRERQGVVAEYQKVLQTSGNAKNGLLVFDKNCSSCHQLGGKGHAIGPNLASSPSRDAAALLVHILDPNQYVLPNYIQYVVVDKSGRTYTGMIVSQTATSVTIKKERDEVVTVLRHDVDELTSTSKSLMPEGLEKYISPEGMADLIAFLQGSMAASTDPSFTRDFGTLPGPVEPAP